MVKVVEFSGAKGKNGFKLRAPWLGFTTLFLFLDVAATLVYSLDISYTENLDELLEFVGLKVPNAISSASSTSSIFGFFTMGPSIIASLIFSRAVLLWATNLALLIHVVQDARLHEKESRTPALEPRQPYQEYLKKMSTIGPIPDAKWEPYQRKRSEVLIVKPLRVPSPPNDRKRKQSDYGQYLYYARQGPQHQLSIIQSEPSTPSIVVTPTERWQMEYPPAELRGQLPWSYFQDRQDVSTPKPIDKESGPPVPVPDYTLRFSTKERPSLENHETGTTGDIYTINSSNATNSKGSSSSERCQLRPDVYY